MPGRPRLDDRTVLNGIVWEFRTGSPDGTCPSDTTPHPRLRPWAEDGTFERMLQAARANADAAEDIEWRSTHGKRLTLRSPQPQSLRLLKITGADALFPITDP
ncbi:hypothetical protein [Streptomyces yangpuensis]|uniref:hypothetical protein n=1 Tax=Streptomyces yangpuensis TaxID=1648182 RepID=UPI00371D568D